MLHSKTSKKTKLARAEHATTLLRRAATTGTPLTSLVKLLARFAIAVQVEKVHPLQDGILRMKHPSERRPGLPPASFWLFWPQFVLETLRKQMIAVSTLIKLIRVMRSIQRDPNTRNYMDQALMPVHDDDETLDLLTKTSGGRAAVAHLKRVDKLIHAHGIA